MPSIENRSRSYLDELHNRAAKVYYWMYRDGCKLSPRLPFLRIEDLNRRIAREIGEDSLRSHRKSSWEELLERATILRMAFREPPVDEPSHWSSPKNRDNHMTHASVFAVCFAAFDTLYYDRILNGDQEQLIRDASRINLAKHNPDFSEIVEDVVWRSIMGNNPTQPGKAIGMSG